MDNKKGKILIVDDEKFFRPMLTEYLMPEYHLIEAECGKTALRLAKTQNPDLILLDIVLSDMDGNEILKNLMSDKKTKSIPVIMVTGKMDKKNIAESLELGAIDYITKPFDKDELLLRIKIGISGKKVADSLARDKRDLSIILEISEVLTSSLKSDEVLYRIVQKIAEVIDTTRCSIVRIGKDENKGYVVASHDDPSIKNLEIDLSKYPEIKKAMKIGKPLVIDDIRHSNLLLKVKPNFQHMRFRSLMVLPIALKHYVLVGTLLLRTARLEPFTEREINFCKILTMAAANAIINAHMFESIQSANKVLERLAVTDGLTDMYNYRYFIIRLENELKTVSRYGQQLSLIMMDIDNFKKINDMYGHQKGDAVLKEIAKIIQNNTRESDISARYGGEEFVMLLPNTIQKNAVVQAERMRSIVELTKFPGVDQKLTISLGISSFPKKGVKTVDDLIQTADNALYAAKKIGKNKTMCYQ